MRSLFLTALNCFVGDEPCVAATSQITAAGMPPAGDVAFVLIRHSQCKPIEFDPSGLCEMKNVFVAVVEKASRADWLGMTVSYRIGLHPHPALLVRVGIATGQSTERNEVRLGRARSSLRRIDRDRFDPVNSILQHKKIAKRQHDLMRQHWVGRRSA